MFESINPFQSKPDRNPSAAEKKAKKIGKTMLEIVRKHPKTSVAVGAIGTLTGVAAIYEEEEKEPVDTSGCNFDTGLDELLEEKFTPEMPAHIAKIELNKLPNEELYFKKIPNGEFSSEEKSLRQKSYSKDVVIFQDIGLDFYKVQKGDSSYKIREKLTKLPQYGYLKEQRGKLSSFNIRSKDLRPDMLIPIPPQREQQVLSDQEFAKYAYLSLNNIINHKYYGEFLKELLKHKQRSEVVATMIAIAKQESGGGGKIGNLALHRWEPHHKKFSFSVFHILMEGPGLKARRKLNMTEGQTHHPQRACELFFAYMIEKTLETGCRSKDSEAECKTKKMDFFVKLFDRDSKLATFYNGAAWTRTNPNYLTNIQTNYRNAHQLLVEDKD